MIFIYNCICKVNVTFLWLLWLLINSFENLLENFPKKVIFHKTFSPDDDQKSKLVENN